MGGKKSGLPGRKLLLLHVCRGATFLGLGGILCNKEQVPRVYPRFVPACSPWDIWNASD